MINVELMGQVRDMIVLHPERHNQMIWACHPVLASMRVQAIRREPDCGTTACVAGWAVILSAPAQAILETFSEGDRVVIDGCRVLVGDYAQKQLGLTEAQADWLFDACVSRDAIIKALDYLPDHPDATDRELDRECGL